MAIGIKITRAEESAQELRRMARLCRDVAQARRLLAIASVMDGHSRTDAATAAGMDRQTLRDWVHRFNAEGPGGLVDKPRRGRLHHAILVDHPALRLGTSAPTPGLGVGDGTARLLQAARWHARLDVRPSLQPLQTGDLVALLGDDVAQSRKLTEQIHNQSFQLGRGQGLDIGRLRQAARESGLSTPA